MRVFICVLIYFAGAHAFELVRQSPSIGSWKRTRCGSPAGTADLPTQWAQDVNAHTQPLPEYPRPMMVRGSAASEADPVLLKRLRDAGDNQTWANLNGLWEWQPAQGPSPVPTGQNLSGTILVPFPVESCFSGVAPASSKDVVMKMFYRTVFRVSVDPGYKLLLHFGAVDWQTSVYVNGQLVGNHTGGKGRGNN